MGRRHGRGQPDHDPGEHALEAHRPHDRGREPRHRMAVQGRRAGEDPAGQRDGLRPPDAPTVPHPRCRALSDPRPRRRGRTKPGVERHGAGANRRDGRHPARRHQPRLVDGALPHRRAPRERHDVLLQRDAVTAHHDVVVVGGGQAGLAIGYLLAQQERSFRILEAADTPAAAWRARWDSLRLFTPVRYDSLPGRAFPGHPDAYPGRDEVVAYLTDYARDFELPLELGSRVRAVRHGDDGYLVELDDRTYEAGQV